MIDQMNIEAGKQLQESHQSPNHVQPVFVGTFLLIVLAVVIEYVLGDFIGLNAGEDLGLVVGSTLSVGICVGLIAGAIHDWKGHADKQ